MKGVKGIIIKFILLSFIILISGCKSLEKLKLTESEINESINEHFNIVRAEVERNNDLGEVPSGYEDEIKEYYLEKVHHPEKLDVRISQPMKMYMLGGLSWDHVKWKGWVVEVSIPMKAVYKWGASDNEDYESRYVLFEGGKVSEYYRNDKTYFVKNVNSKFKGKGFIETGDGSIIGAWETGFDKNGNYINPNVYEGSDENIIKIADIDKENNIQVISPGEAINLDRSKELKKIYKAYKDGVISKEEFDKQRIDLLDI